MYTGTHLVLSQFFATMNDFLPTDHHRFISGGVRPDRMRGGMSKHGSLSTCRTSVADKRDRTIPQAAKPSWKEHERGVLLHYLQDSLDRSKNAGRASGGSNEVIRDTQHVLAYVLLHCALLGGPPPGPDYARDLTWVGVNVAKNTIPNGPPAEDFDHNSVEPVYVDIFNSRNLDQLHPDNHEHRFPLVPKKVYDFFVDATKSIILAEVLSAVTGQSPAQWADMTWWQGQRDDIQACYHLKQDGSTPEKTHARVLKTLAGPVYRAYLKCSQAPPHRHQCWRCDLAMSAGGTCFSSFWHVKPDEGNTPVVRTRRLMPYLIEDYCKIAALAFA